MPGLDGLRAVAVLGVLLYHADISWMPGGFLGVEVFFVISGYLITSLLLSEWAAGAEGGAGGQGRIDLKRFWIRRARRLLPALYALLGLTTLYVAFRLAHELPELRGDVTAALTYVTNWYLIVQEQSYFQVMGRPSLLQHLWSLAVEEQFYILWPPLLVIGLRLLRRRGAFVALLLATLASSALMVGLYEPGSDPSRVYYGTDTRAAGLLAGSALAFLWDPWRLSAAASGRLRRALDPAALALLAAVVVWMTVVDESTSALYRGGFLLLDLNTVLLIAAVVHPASRVGRALGVAPLRWVGLRSYAIYLWHWPVFLVTRPWIDVTLDALPLLAYRLLLTFALAEASYRWVEQPLRHGDPARLRQLLRPAGLRAGLTRARPRAMAGQAGLATFLAVAGLPVFGHTPLAVDRAEAARAHAATDLDILTQASAPHGARLAAGGLGPTHSPAASAEAPASSIGDRPAAGSGASQEPAGRGAGAPLAAGPTRPPVLPAERLREPWLAGAQRARARHGTAVPEWLVPDPDRQYVPPDLDMGLSDPSLLGPARLRQPRGTAPFTATIQVTFVGDSVMLGAAPALERVFGPTAIVDATISRQFGAGVETVTAYARAGLLGDVTVIHLGNNGNLSGEQFDAMMSVLAGVPRVFFLTVKVPRRWESTVNEVVTAGVGRWPNARLLDWRGHSRARPYLFMDDGIHLLPPGRDFYAYLILDAIEGAMAVTGGR